MVSPGDAAAEAGALDQVNGRLSGQVESAHQVLEKIDGAEEHVPHHARPRYPPDASFIVDRLARSAKRNLMDARPPRRPAARMALRRFYSTPRASASAGWERCPGALGAFRRRRRPADLLLYRPAMS